MNFFKKGFTIIELLMIITIIAILGGLAYASLTGIDEAAKETAARTTLKEVRKSIETDKALQGRTVQACDEEGNKVENGVKGFLCSNNSFNGIKGLELNSNGIYTTLGSKIYYVVTFDGNYFALGVGLDGTGSNPNSGGEQVIANVDIPHGVRYIRDYLNGSNLNTGSHFLEIQAIEEGTGINLLAGNIGTSNTPVQGTRTLNYATDGDTHFGNFAGFDNGATIPTYIEYDLGAEYQLEGINVWHYWNDSRIYNDSRTDISWNGTDWFTIRSGNYTETSAGMTMTVDESLLTETVDS